MLKEIKKWLREPKYQVVVGSATTGAEKARLAEEIGRMTADKRTHFQGQIVATEELKHALAAPDGTEIIMGLHLDRLRRPVGGFCGVPRSLTYSEMMDVISAPFGTRLVNPDNGKEVKLGSKSDRQKIVNMLLEGE